MAGVHNGYLLEFPQIRVDCFTSRPRTQTDPWLLPSPADPIVLSPARPAQLYLLTHVHTDHLTGLSDTFTGRIVCSLDTKRMLLRLQGEKERLALLGKSKETAKRKYEGLQAKVMDRGTKYERVVDNIEALPYNYPKEYELGLDDEGRPIKVTITLLDANHFTSPDKAILHTGDVRADKLFIQSLRRNPALGPFVAPLTPGPVTSGGGRRVLDRMYLDTSAMLGTGDMPQKEDAIQDLLHEMSLYPPDTYFFLNTWCFGWEDIIKEVARHFDTLVHVDAYKASIYDSLTSDTFLANCTTQDHRATRFHACERKFKCPSCRLFNDEGARVYNLDRRVVSVNMAEVKSAQYMLEREDFVDRLGKAATGEGDWPLSIVCPFARHAPLPELQNLVRLLRPRSLSPNTLAPPPRDLPLFKGIEYYVLPEYFKDCLQPDSGLILQAEMTAYFERIFGAAHLAKMRACIGRTGVIMPSIGQVQSGGPVGPGRQANVRDHIECIIGTGPADLAALLDDGPIHQHDDRRDDPFYAGTGYRLGGDEQSDESQDQRKRRRYQVESMSSFDSHNSPHEPASSTPPVKVKSPIDCKPRIPRGTAFGVKAEPDHKPARRFGLDKSHLQALSQVDV